jgi:hypothetical protein
LNFAVPAAAHTTEGGIVLLLPTAYYIAGGTIVVALTFLLLLFVPARLFHCLVRWRKPLGDWPALPPLVGSSLSFAILVALLIAGLIGSRDPLANPLPLAVWTLFWIGLTILQALAGDIWAVIISDCAVPASSAAGPICRCRAVARFPMARLLAGRAGLSPSAGSAGHLAPADRAGLRHGDLLISASLADPVRRAGVAIQGRVLLGVSRFRRAAVAAAAVRRDQGAGVSGATLAAAGPCRSAACCSCC